MLVVIINFGTNHGILLILDDTLNCNTSIGAGHLYLTLNQADVIGDQSDAVTQNAWLAISGEISILIQTVEESWGRFPVPRICRWESITPLAIIIPEHSRTISGPWGLYTQVLPNNFSRCIQSST